MRKYIYLGISLCMLLTAVFVVRFVYDVLKAAWCACRGKDIRWKVFEIFTDNDDWKSILIWGVVVCVGAYGFFQANTDMLRAEYEEAEVYCNICSTPFPEKYDTLFYDGSVCPDCSNRTFNTLVKRENGICVYCGEIYTLDRPLGTGLCDDCYQESHGECVNCGNYAEFELKDTYDEYWCIYCIGEAMQSKNVTRAIRNYIDHGY